MDDTQSSASETMEYERRDFLKDSDPTVSGFTVLDVNESEREYKVGEKWERKGEPDKWADYWVSEEEIQDRRESGTVEHIGKVTEDQFERIAEKTDPRALA